MGSFFSELLVDVGISVESCKSYVFSYFTLSLVWLCIYLKLIFTKIYIRARKEKERENNKRKKVVALGPLKKGEKKEA